MGGPRPPGPPVAATAVFMTTNSYISTDSNIEHLISTRIGLAWDTFKNLNNIWKSSALQTKTKLKIYNSYVRSVLLYVSETWRAKKKIECRLKDFEGCCLRRILKIGWEHVTNMEVNKLAGVCCIVEEEKKRRWRWLSHVTRMSKTRPTQVALRLTPPGKRRGGRPLGT